MKQTLVAMIVAISAASASAGAAGNAEDMAIRYQDLMRCMDQAMGKGWSDRYDIKLSRNRWGAPEVRTDDIEGSPQAIKLVDLRCRRELNLDGQTRPD